MDNENEKKYYSVPEAAKLLGISRIAVFKKVKSKTIKALRIGRNWAIPADELHKDAKGKKNTKSQDKNILSKKIGDTLVQASNGVIQNAQISGIIAPDDKSDDEMNSMGWD